MKIFVPFIISGWVGNSSLVALDLDYYGSFVEYLGGFPGEGSVV